MGVFVYIYICKYIHTYTYSHSCLYRFALVHVVSRYIYIYTILLEVHACIGLGIRNLWLKSHDLLVKGIHCLDHRPKLASL